MIARRAFLTSAAATALTACAGEPVWAPDDIVASKTYRSGGPTALTLYTMRSVSSGNGEHSSLLVDASQRVMFDPAGTFRHSTIPERNDVLFGVTPQVEAYYISYHARQTFYVIGQKLLVSPQVAEAALQMVMAHGAVPKANCTRATSSIMRRLPGFGDLPQTWFPNTLAAAFGRYDGVTTEEYREQDGDDKTLAAQQIDMQIRADQSR